MSSKNRRTADGRVKSTRASEEQKQELVSYFEKNPVSLRVINGGTVGDPKSKQRIWIELAHRLNTITGGSMKSTSKWSKYWNDIILYTKNRAQQSIMGDKVYRAPNDFDKSLLLLIGQYDLLKKWSNAVKNVEHIKYEESDAESEFDENSENIIIEKTPKLLHTESYNNDDVKDRITVQLETVEIQTIPNRTASPNEEAETLNEIEKTADYEIESYEESLVTYCPPVKKVKRAAAEEPTRPQLNQTAPSPSNPRDDLAEALREFPQALNAMAQSFVILGASIEKLSNALEKYNNAK